MVSRVESGTLLYYQLYEPITVLHFNSSPITRGLMLLLQELGIAYYVLFFFAFGFCPNTNFCISLDIWSNAEIMILNRYFLLILGNERTLTNEENVWKSLVLDAKKRRCFFNADEDKELAKSIWDTKKELDQLDDLLNPDSFLFKKSRWKVFVISFLKFYIFFLLSIFQSCF